MLLVIGHSTMGMANEPQPERYIVQAFMAEISEAQMNALNLQWHIDSSRMMARLDVDNLVSLLESDNQNAVSTFPLLHIDVGERRSIDLQTPVSFPVSYNEQGEATEYESRGVGKLIDIHLKYVTNGMVRLAYVIEDVKEPTWYPYRISDSVTVMQPVFSMRSIRSDTTESLIPLNTWSIIGGLNRHLEDGTVLRQIAGVIVSDHTEPNQTMEPTGDTRAGDFD